MKSVSDFQLLIRKCPNTFSSAAQLCLTLFDPMDCSMPGFPVHHPIAGAYSNSCPSRW